jgi:hypothetical protein
VPLRSSNRSQSCKANRDIDPHGGGENAQRGREVQSTDNNKKRAAQLLGSASAHCKAGLHRLRRKKAHKPETRANRGRPACREDGLASLIPGVPVQLIV